MPLPNPDADETHADARLDADAPITVDLKESDPAKAITRNEAQAEEPLRPKRRDDKTDQFAKRIGRLRHEMQSQFDQRLAEIQAENQRELRSVGDKLDRLIGGRAEQGVDADQQKHERLIAELEAQLADALEKGESTRVAKLQSQISQEHARFASAQTAKLMGDTYQARERPRDPDEQTPSTRRGPTRLAKQFMRVNADWWYDPEFKIERHAAGVIDQELMDEGSDPNTEEHYEEVQARLQDKFPDLDVALPAARRTRDEDEYEERPKARLQQRPLRGGPLSANRGDAPRSGRGVRMTEADIAAMRKFHLDPNKPEHVVAYANELQGNS